MGDVDVNNNNKNNNEVLDAKNDKFRPEEPVIGGADLLLPSSNNKKIIFDGRLPSGFDILNIELPNGKSFPTKSKMKQLSKTNKDGNQIIQYNHEEEEDKTIHFTSSIIAFENKCYIWNNIHSIHDVTYESLLLITLYYPKIDILFIGCDTPLEYNKLKKLQERFLTFNIAIEQLDIANAMATFNMLNSEDRVIAVALVLEDDDEETK